jgi:hypothetical protein
MDARRPKFAGYRAGLGSAFGGALGLVVALLLGLDVR